MASRTARRRVLRITVPGSQREPAAAERADLLATEEPLGIRVNGQALAMTMRTPGDDIDLAAGFLISEGIVRAPGDITQIVICTGERCGHSGSNGTSGSAAPHEGAGNIADVTLRPGLAVAPEQRRAFLTSSACGVCGKTSIAELAVATQWDLSADSVRVPPAVLAGLPGALRAAQRVFAATGGLHAAGLFTAAGELLAVREDVGRHNAVDKIVGWALRSGRLPLSGCILLVSGRASFELVQKAVLAGIPVLAAVSAPSSLAADLAAESGLTLVGFLRGGSMNVYAGSDRVEGHEGHPDPARRSDQDLAHAGRRNHGSDPGSSLVPAPEAAPGVP
ncbi:MAG TPA: formate dehydrogenase accessory sulfurtransferase FdhD [Streptosporangiaceae bacterium]|nr:formate dehydrogenase accessory sulfurtransferase FdhD [Streptosporangiaceae bacterium]